MYLVVDGYWDVSGYLVDLMMMNDFLGTRSDDRVRGNLWPVNQWSMSNYGLVEEGPSVDKRRVRQDRRFVNEGTSMDKRHVCQDRRLGHVEYHWSVDHGGMRIEIMRDSLDPNNHSCSNQNLEKRKEVDS